MRVREGEFVTEWSMFVTGRDKWGQVFFSIMMHLWSIGFSISSV